ncbi:hypothetical protein, conserved [Leishmania tarentolae]|uniref:Uncharacterized protein n=1 Tax=Leishmania tarentolae TaxID=5689 RepID=A0A640KNG2_LEITA|nr:hypothetical protein, conserved [Leishmania tarentolae]
MPHASKQLVPIGCNMNDAAYPFRGEHRLANCMNHGHSGVVKRIPTSIAMRITGSNLVIEEVKTPKGVELECELGVDGGIARPVSLQNAAAFMVPGDGHDYNLIAALRASGNPTKHYCKLTFNGSEGVGVLRVRAPEGCSPDVVYIVADGRRLRPTAGVFRIPIQTKECALVANLPLPSGPPPPPSFSFTATPPLPLATTDKLSEKTPGASTDATVVSGEVPELETRIHPPLIPDTGDATVTKYTTASMPSFVATAPGFNVQLTGENGSTACGVGVAALPLSHRRAQTVQIVVSDAQGRVLLRQRSHVPSLEAAAVFLALKDDEKGELALSGNPGSKIVVGGVPQADPSATAVLPRVAPQQVVAVQHNADGSVSNAILDVAPASVPASVAVVVPQQPQAPTQTPPEIWVKELCEALQSLNPEEQRRLVQNIHPSSIPGMTIVNFVRDQLTHQPPAISFTISNNGLEALQCPGYSVTAAIGNDPAFQIPALGSVALTPGKTALLTAMNTLTHRAVSCCRVQMAMPSTMTFNSATASAYPPNAAAGSLMQAGSSADENADSALVNRLVDCLLRHNLSAPLVAKELDSMPTAPFSAQGRRTLSLLANCLRSATASGAAAAIQAASAQAAEATHAASEEIFFTCGPGYVDNIYTSQSQYQLFGAVDHGAPQTVPQRGRIPAQGTLEGEQKPFFIHITARDPTTGAIKVERTITVLGVRHEARPSPGTAEAPSPAQVNNTTEPSASGAPALASGQQLSPGSAGWTIPYMDVSLQAVGQDVQARISCHPHLRIVCDVDGVGGNTGRSDFVAKMPATCLHQVNFSLIDLHGRVVFQQKLGVPAMASSLWGLALQHNGLAVDPEGGALVTASINRAVERTLQGNFVSFDAGLPHFVHLRRYHNGIHDGCAGEVSLRLPGFTLPAEVEEVTRIMRRRANGETSDPQTKKALEHLRARCTVPSIVELITSILDGWSAPVNADARTSGGDSSSSRIFFRLTGTD